jgi:hypothetical protein
MKKTAKKMEPIVELLMLVVDRDFGDNTVKILNSLHVDLQLLSLGYGTADSTMDDYLGLDKRQKSIIFALIKLKDSEKILKIMEEKFNFNKRNTGLALTIPIKSATLNLIEQMGYVL